MRPGTGARREGSDLARWWLAYPPKMRLVVTLEKP